MKHLLPYLKKYRLEAVLAPLFKMLEACFDLTVPLIVAKIIDVGIVGRDKSYIFTHFLLLIAMALLGLLCSFCGAVFRRARRHRHRHGAAAGAFGADSKLQLFGA